MEISETYALVRLRKKVNKRILEYSLLEDSAGYIYYYDNKCKDFGKLSSKKLRKIIKKYKGRLLMFNDFETNGKGGSDEN